MEKEQNKNFIMSVWTKFKDRMTPARVVLFGFLTIIFTGAVLLTLPVAAKSRESIGFVNALFMSTSAVCVTGLSVIDPAVTLSLFGQFVILLLIQIGGLGFMTTTTFMFLLVGKRISLKERLAMQESLSQESMKGVVKLTKRILIFTFAVEAVGAFVMSFVFVPIMGFWKGAYTSLFTAVSAFCNAGLDVLGVQYGEYASLSGLYGNAVVVLTVAVLIIIGGLGFLVFADLFHRKKSKKLRLHTKVSLGMTCFLLAAGFACFLSAEFNNPGTLGNMSVGDKIMNAFFQSVTARTAGFSTVNQADLREGSKLATIVLMFIGACPASTGGGVKTTTLFVMLAVLISTLRDREDIIVGKEAINRKTTLRVVTIMTFAFVVVIFQTLILWAAETTAHPDESFMSYAFESVSAFGTVGLSTGITPSLSVISKLTLGFTMFIGRLGPLTLGMAIMQKARKNNVKIKYPDAKILIG